MISLYYKNINVINYSSSIDFCDEIIENIKQEIENEEEQIQKSQNLIEEQVDNIFLFLILFKIKLLENK